MQHVMDEQQNGQQTQSNPQPAAAPAGAGSQSSAPKSDAEQNKWWAVLAYFGILSLIPLFAKKGSPFAQHHAKQGVVLFLAGIVINIVAAFLPSGANDAVNALGGLAVFILGILGIVNAYQGKMWEMPVLGEWAKKIKV